MSFAFRASVLIACLVCSPAFLWAQASIEGRVLNQDKQPVAGAKVQVEKLPAGSRLSATSGANGTFRFPALDAGDYKITVEDQLYFPRTSQVLLRPRQALSLQFELAPRAHAREEVNVQAYGDDAKVQQTGSAIAFSHHDLEQLPAAITKDVPTLAENLVPGAVASHDNFIHLRGNELSLHEFINGVSFLDNAHQHFTPGISPQIFESVNVITGGFPAEFGNRFGGILDITTRSGSDLDGHGSLSLGLGTVSNDDASAEYGGKKGRFGYYFFGGGFSSDRFLNPPVPDALHDFGFGVRGAGQLDYQGEKNIVKLLVTGGGTRFEIPNTEEQEELGRDARRRLNSQTAILSWQHIFSPRLVLSTSLYERTVADHVVPTSDPFTQRGQGGRDTMTVGIKTDASYTIGRHNFKAGVDLTRLDLRERFDFDPQLEDPEPEAFGFRGSRHGGQASLYAQDHITVRDFTFDLGVRWDQFDMIDTNVGVSPRFGVAYHIRPTGTTLHFAYNHFFSPPPLEYLLLGSFIGNNAEDPELLTGNVRPFTQNFYEVGLNQQLGRNFSAEVNAYWHRGRNAFENSEISNTRVFVPTNFDKEHSHGLEFTLNMKQLESVGISARLQYAYARTDIFGPITGGLADEVLLPGEQTFPAYDQRHTGTASLYYRNRWRHFWAGSNLRYGSGTPSEGVRLPQHLTADLASGVTLLEREKRQLDLELNLLNVADTRYKIAKESELTPIQYSPERVFSARLRWHF